MCSAPLMLDMPIYVELNVFGCHYLSRDTLNPDFDTLMHAWYKILYSGSLLKYSGVLGLLEAMHSLVTKKTPQLLWFFKLPTFFGG